MTSANSCIRNYDKGRLLERMFFIQRWLIDAALRLRHSMYVGLSGGNCLI